MSEGTESDGIFTWWLPFDDPELPGGAIALSLDARALLAALDNLSAVEGPGSDPGEYGGS